MNGTARPPAPLDAEEWRAVVGWECLYEVSSLGRVRRLRPYRGATYAGRVMRGGHDPDGYVMVSLSDRSRRTRVAVHRLVCEAFHGSKPSSLSHAAHWSGNKDDNSASNLRWATPAENMGNYILNSRTALACLRQAGVALILGWGVLGAQNSGAYNLLPTIMTGTPTSPSGTTSTSAMPKIVGSLMASANAFPMASEPGCTRISMWSAIVSRSHGRPSDGQRFGGTHDSQFQPSFFSSPEIWSARFQGSASGLVIVRKGSAGNRLATSARRSFSASLRRLGVVSWTMARSCVWLIVPSDANIRVLLNISTTSDHQSTDDPRFCFGGVNFDRSQYNPTITPPVANVYSGIRTTYLMSSRSSIPDWVRVIEDTIFPLAMIVNVVVLFLFKVRGRGGR